MKRLFVFLLALGALSCGKSDFGAPCRVTTGNGQYLTQLARPAGDVTSVSLQCAEQVCVSNAGSTDTFSDDVVRGYCSLSCAGNAECPAGAECRAVGATSACFTR